jgi:epoxyqueuosine reductase
VRNCLIAAGNSGDMTLLPRVIALLSDGSPLVRGMAVWALRELAGAAAVAEQRRLHPNDTDAAVEQEWREASSA